MTTASPRRAAVPADAVLAIAAVPAVSIGHVLRNSLGAALSMTGLQVGLMFSGVVVIEEIC